jgi:hypothetical protein
VLTPALVFLALGACRLRTVGGHEVGGTGTALAEAGVGADTGPGDGALGDLDVAVVHSVDGIWLDVEGGPASDYFFGIAGDGYTGEDCIPGNADARESRGFDKCHHAHAHGGRWSALDLSNPQERTLYAEDFDDLYTVFGPNTNADALTFILASYEHSADCWTWGARPGYYFDYGCEEW